jgi:hypothetical protein
MNAPEQKWTAFYKFKYDEWHIGVPVESGSMKFALCPDGILPGIERGEREKIATFIAASCNACADIPNPAAIADVVAAADGMIAWYYRIEGKDPNDCSPIGRLFAALASLRGAA